MTTNLVMGIDLGTQSTRVIIYDPARLELVASASSELAMIADDGGTREQMASWWVEALLDCMEQLPTAAKSSVGAMGVSGQQHGLVMLDAHGAVVAPVKLWCDTTSAPQCAEIMAAFGGEAPCLEEVGNLLLPGYTAPKIRWARQHRPQEYAAMRSILLPHDYLNYYLTGRQIMEMGDASGTGLLDIRRRCWHAGMLRAVDAERDLADCLPELIPCEQPSGILRAELAAQWGMSSRVLVSSGGGDNMMGAIGTGNTRQGCITLSLGTSGTLYAYSDDPVVDPTGYLAAFCSSSGGWLPLFCTMNCTVATEQNRGLFELDLEQLETLSASAAPGSGGVITLPFYQGERAPNLPYAKGCILGLDDTNNSRENILRSAMEAAIYSLRFGLDKLRAQGITAAEIRLTGGGAASATWRQIAADVLNVPVVALRDNEGAALGAALQALYCLESERGSAVTLDALANEHVALDEDTRALPDNTRVARYNHHYARYQEYVGALGELFATPPAVIPGS
jgi:xylulokinase